MARKAIVTKKAGNGAGTERKLDARVVRSKAAILEEAVRVIWERGPAAFRVETVSERTGIALTTIYRHWPSRKDLLTDAIASMANVGQLPDTGSLQGDMLEFFTFRTHRMQQLAPWERSLMTLPGIIEAARHDAEIAIVSDYTMRGLLSGLKLMLERSRARGEITTGRDLDVMADVLLGAVIIRQSYRGQDATDEYIADLVDIMVDTLNLKSANPAKAAGASAARKKQARPLRA